MAIEVSKRMACRSLGTGTELVVGPDTDLLSDLKAAMLSSASGRDRDTGAGVGLRTSLVNEVEEADDTDEADAGSDSGG
jgi:hypothetical protein